MLPSRDPWSYPVFCGPGALTHPRPAIRPLDYSREPEVEEEAFPEPLVTSRDGIEPPAKSAVHDLVAYAQERGWTVARNQYAEGFWANVRTGKPGAAPKESIAVRLERGDRYAVAVYVGGSTWTWDVLYLMEAGKPWRHFKTITAFREAL